MKPFPILICCAIACLAQAGTSRADAPEGFTEPFRQIDIATAEAGILKSVDVAEGDQVKADQVVAELQREVLLASLAVARKLKDAKGKLNSAMAELRQKTAYLEKLQKLLAHASQEELEKAGLEKEVAEAQLLAVREELEVRELEYQKIEEELERRRMRSPINGVVVRIDKEPGEFVSPAHPVVMTVVQLDPLLAVFSVPPDISNTLTPSQAVKVRIGASSTNTEAIVHFLSPVMDAQSGTVLLKVRIPNPAGRLRAGEKCRLVVGSGNPLAVRAEEPLDPSPEK